MNNEKKEHNLHLGLLLKWVLPYIVTIVVLLNNVTFENYDYSPRFWNDVKLAVGYFLYDEFVVSDDWISPIENQLTQNVPLLKFWETIQPENFSLQNVHGLDYSDDIGRAWIMGLLFKVLGGVSPNLYFLEALILFIPVLGWLSFGLYKEGYWVASIFVLLTLGLSAFVSGTMTLAYSPVGFYVLCIFVLAAFSAFSFFSENPTRLKIILQVAIAGIYFMLCVVSRGPSLFLLPGFLLPLWSLSNKSYNNSPKRKNGKLQNSMFILLCFLFILPALSAKLFIHYNINRTYLKYNQEEKNPKHHPLWHGIWCGLGDFDEKKGFIWKDSAAQDAVTKAGGPKLDNINMGGSNPEYERILKTEIVSAIKQDPLWYLSILRKRIAATIFQLKIIPWQYAQGIPMIFEKFGIKRTIDSYYLLTFQVDFIRLYNRTVELPLVLLVVTTWIYVGLGLTKLFSRNAKSENKGKIKNELLYLCSIAIAAFGCPLLITTANAIETQCFAFVYYFGAAFVLQRGLEIVRRTDRGRR